MIKDFFGKQSEENRNIYIKLLQVTGALSNLFAESSNPFLYYRAMENIFCKAFEAENLSRSDVSADAAKTGLGIGLKTFLHSNGNTFQKVAEFNKESYLLRGLEKRDLVEKVAEMRNKRIEATKDICSLDDMMYHLVTRHRNAMTIYEEHMDAIDIDNIRLLKSGGNNTVHFTDGINEYNFSLSKNTLLKRFDVSKLRFVETFGVEILEDPFDFLLSQERSMALSGRMEEEEFEDFIVLPLYSPRSGEVEEKSGLNMWNAGGRARDENEVYIPVPSWIHEKKEGFFEYKEEDPRKTDSFTVVLPNGKELSMKVTQQGGKALQSDPNKELGRWILRDVLKLKPGELATKEMLDSRGIDSIRLSKDGKGVYHMDFLKVGSFEEYRESVLEDIN